MNKCKKFSYFVSSNLLLIIAIVVSGAASLGAETLPPILTNVTTSNGSILINWTGGRPTFQVQMSTDPGGAWSNIGPITSNTSTALPATGSSSFFRVVSDCTAQYQVTFNGLWTQQTHPDGWTTNGHFTPLCGGVHSSAVHFWRTNEFATEGTRLMAQYGYRPTMLSEVDAAITNGSADFELAGPNLRPSDGTVNFIFPQPMRRDFPLVTLCSMIGPSPDWFVGVDSLNLLQNGSWITNLTATLWAHDAGVDTVTNLTFDPPYTYNPARLPISRMTTFPALQNGSLVPFATFVFTRLD